MQPKKISKLVLKNSYISVVKVAEIKFGKKIIMNEKGLFGTNKK